VPERLRCSFDAVAVGQAFHWFRVGEALAEVHRVLRPGGGFPHGDAIPAEAAVEPVASISALAAASPERRAVALDEVRELVGAGTVRFPMMTTVALAHRA
jgi:SAM-dependent methyltransferase